MHNCSGGVSHAACKYLVMRVSGRCLADMRMPVQPLSAGVAEGVKGKAGDCRATCLSGPAVTESLFLCAIWRACRQTASSLAAGLPEHLCPPLAAADTPEGDQTYASSSSGVKPHREDACFSSPCSASAPGSHKCMSSAHVCFPTGSCLRSVQDAMLSSVRRQAVVPLRCGAL